MKGKVFLILLALCLVGLFQLRQKPAGSIGAGERSSLTNHVRTITTDPIIRVEQLDKVNWRVSTGTVRGQQDRVFERTGSGWRLVQSFSTRPGDFLNNVATGPIQ